MKDESLGPTMNQGLITPIPKPDKDRRYMDNFWPITFLNSDYKIFTCIYANILKVGIDNLTNRNQDFLKEDLFIII